MRNILGSRRGTTLVEILVTMVVLLIGIMTVVQMFPTGFGVVRAAESMTIATKLAQSELERWKATSANLPTGIVPIDANGNVLKDQRPDTYAIVDPSGAITGWRAGFRTVIEDPTGDIAGPDGTTYTRGNVLNMRQVIGETTRIPVGSYFNTAVGSIYGARYALAFGPIDVKRDERGNLDGLKVKSGELRRRSGRQEYYPPSLRLGEYAIDYGEGSEQFVVAFPRDTTAPSRLFYVSYSFWATNDATNEQELISVLDQEVELPGDQGDWVPVNVQGHVPTGYSFNEMESGTDSCARGFQEVKEDGWSDDDPYEFALADNILGVIAFNPKARDRYEYTAQGVKPIEARVSYRILDPRIIREDKIVPPPEEEVDSAGHTRPLSSVKMALRFILALDDPTDNPDEPTYKGLAPAAGLTKPLMIIDLATGRRVDLQGVSPSSPADDVEIDYQAGVVKLPPQSYLLMWDYEAGKEVRVGEPIDLAGKHLRFLYRADGDWTMQCQKAFALYAREWGANELAHNYYKVGGTSNSPRLYFAACESEKTVSVDYTYIDPADSAEHKIVGESHKISDSAETGTQNLHYIDLNMPKGCRLGRVYAVVGTSFRVRVIWRDSKAWRYVDVDTNLSRGQ